MPKNKNSKSFEIALSGIACAIAVIFLFVGTMVPYLLATGYFMAIVALMLPITKQFYKGAFFAYICTCILTLVMGAVARVWDLVPFIIFFGLHPIVNAVQEKRKFNKLLALLLKGIWFDLMLVASYHLVFNGMFGLSFLPDNIYEIVNKYIYLFIATLGTLFFILYDFIVFKTQVVVNMIIARIKK